MGLALVGLVVAIVIAVRTESFHARFVAISAAAWAYFAYVWLCCVLARARGYRAAWGLVGLSIVGGLALPFLPVEPEGPLAKRQEFAWIGARHVLAMFVTYGLIGAAFWNSFESGWVLDNLYIIKYDPRTKANTWADPEGAVPEISPGVRNYFTKDYWWPKGISGLYRPLTGLTYWINWTVLGNGEDTRGYHVVNLVVHWMNAALVYALAFVLIRRWGVALVAALIFAVHPITTESVTNIIGRADLFAALAVLSGLLVWRWACGLHRWHVLWGFFAVMLITAFGAFAKESAVAIGLVILIYDLAYRWNPVLARWFGMILLVGLVPAISAGMFGIARPFAELSGGLRIAIAAVIVLAGLGVHVVASRRSPHARLAALLWTLVLAVSASAFVPAAGIALMLLLVVYEYFAGPWLSRHLPDFAAIRVPAFVYTSLFVIIVFLPLAVGSALWHTAGADAKHAIGGNPGTLGMLNVLGGNWPGETPGGEPLDWGERVVLALAFVLVGLAVHLHFCLRNRIARLLILLLGVCIPLLAAIVLEAEVAVLLWLAGIALLPAGAAGWAARTDRRPAAWLSVPVVLVAALAASLFIFYAGFVLTFIVGLIELIRRDAMPRALRDNVVWSDMIRRFAVGYYLLLPPVIAMMFVRYWIFNIESTPPETPFLDNPLRGGPFDPLPFWQSRMTAIKVMGKLIYLLFWPVHLSSDYSHDQIPFFLGADATVWENLKTLVALAVIVGAIWLAVRSFHRNKPLFFFIMFFFAAILPTSNLPTLIGSIMAERFMYLPLIGFAGAAAIGAAWVYGWILRGVERAGLPLLPARAAVGFLVPAIIFGLYTWRSYIRNFDWRSDITLWEAAIEVSPRSFRCYQSLAFAYYERYAEQVNRGVPPKDLEHEVDLMIRTAEGARPIVDPLPHDRNSSRLYLHLGMYYGIKAELVSRRDSAGNLVTTPEARQWLQKAVDALERGVEVDRTFSEVNRRRQIARGDPPDMIHDAGLTPVYMTLGSTYHRLGMYREAFNALQYQRQLEPNSPEPYVRIALMMIEQGRADDAGIALIQALLLDGSRQEAWQLLAQLYASAGPQAQGALLQDGRGVRLNIEHPIVRNHFVGAYREFIRIFRRANRNSAAEMARRAAVYTYKMPPAFFDSVMVEPLMRVTPDGLEDFEPPTPDRPVNHGHQSSRDQHR